MCLPAPSAATILISKRKELGILVCNANYAPDSVADFTIMMMLMCLRQYKQAFGAAMSMIFPWQDWKEEI